MKEFKDLSSEEQKAYMAELENEIKPLEARGILKKQEIRGKNLYKTPVNIMKLTQCIQLALKEKNGDYNTVKVNGQIVLLSLPILLSMLLSVNEDGTEEGKKLDTYVKELQNKESVKRIESQFLAEEIGQAQASIKPADRPDAQDLIVTLPVMSNDKPGEEEEELKKWIMDKVNKTSTVPKFIFNKSMIAFSKASPPQSEFNTLVYVNLPFTVYVPNYFTFLIETPIEARVKFVKNWTESTKYSDNFDIYSDVPLFYRRFEMKTPGIPFDPLEGWLPKFNGVNFEDGYNSGVYRYTSVLLEFDTDFTKEQMVNNEYVANELSKTASEIINFLITVYKHTNKELTVKNISRVMMTQAYFITYNQGFYFIDDTVIRDAKINNSIQLINDFKEKAEEGFTPAAYQIVLLNSKTTFLDKQFNLTVIEAFQATDIFLEEVLLGLAQAKGMSQADIDNMFDTQWKTTVRIEKVLMQLTGKGLSQIDSKLSKEWQDSYKNVRNKVVHKNFKASEQQAKESIDINEKVIELIKRTNNIS